MEERKIKVFVASTSEASDDGILDEIINGLNNDFEVLDWRKIMKQNRSALDSLLEVSLMVDKALFIGTGDDKVEGVRKDRGVKLQHRDNVIFELGLFMGTLGRDNCTYLVENDTLKDIMSDFKGINVSVFERRSVKNIIPSIIEDLKINTRNLSIFPSNTLAMIYHENFLKPLYTSYFHDGGICLNDNSNTPYKRCFIDIIIPNTICEDTNQQFAAIKLLKYGDYKDVAINCIGRPRKLLVYVNNEDELRIVDFPTILIGVKSVIELLLPQLSENDSVDYDSIISRELSRFVGALKLLVSRRTCKNITVNLINEDGDII